MRREIHASLYVIKIVFLFCFVFQTADCRTTTFKKSTTLPFSWPVGALRTLVLRSATVVIALQNFCVCEFLKRQDGCCRTCVIRRTDALS